MNVCFKDPETGEAVEGRVVSTELDAKSSSAMKRSAKM